MESHNRNKRGRRIMEEPQHRHTRPSPIATAAHSTSESYELERTSSKIQHTREHVENLKQRIDYELDKLKKFRDYFVKVGDSERSVKKPVSKVVQRKHMTWRESLEANRTRRNRVGGIPGEIKRGVAVKSSPESGNSKESPHKKGPTPPEKYTPKPTPKDKESGEKRPTGGWCWCCGQCSYPCSVYQGSYGSACNGACDCDCITNGCCNWNPDQQYPLQDCREVSPHQECRFGIPYRVFPRQTANRKVSDLNTEEYLRNAKDCAAMMPDRAMKPIKKCQRSPSSGSKRTESSGRAKNPKGVAMLKLDKKCTKNQEKKLEKLCEKPVKKEQRTIKKEVKREQRTMEKPVKKEPKCTWEKDRKIKDENYENYIRMYEQENCQDIPPECADNKGPPPCNMKGRTFPQVEKCPVGNQPSTLMDSDKIREKIRKLIDLKNFQGHQGAEEKPYSCEVYNEPRNLPELGREKSEIQICLPWWCTDHGPCNAQQENSSESFDEALNRKCLEEMARKKVNPKMECNYFMEGGPTGTCPEDPCLNQNPSNTSLFNSKSSFEIENHGVISRKTCECRKETLVRQQPRNERSLPSHYAGQLREPCLGSRAYQYRSNSPERSRKAQAEASCRKESPTQTEPQNMCEKASQVNMVRQYQRDTGGSQKRSAQPDKNSFAFRSGAETKRKFESPNRKKVDKDCGCSSRAQGNYPRETAVKKEKPQHIYKKEMSKQSYTDDCNHQQPNRTFERRPREKHRGGSPQATYDQAGRFQKELCKGLSKHVVCGKETLSSNMPTYNENKSSSQPSSDSHDPYTSYGQPKWNENSRECNQNAIPFQKRKGSYDHSYSPHEERNTPLQEPCSHRTRNTPKYNQERQDYGDSYSQLNQDRDRPYSPFNQNLKREPPNQTINSKDFYTTLPSSRNQRDCERLYDECMKRKSVSQRKEPYNPQGLSKDTRSSPCEPGNRGNQRELKESSTDSNVGFNYQLKYHPSGFLSPLKGRHNGSYHPESGSCHSQRCNCERCVAQSRNQGAFNKSYQNQNNDYTDVGSPVERYKSMTRSTPPNFSYFYQVSDDPKNTKRNPDNEVAYSPNKANYTNKCGEREYEGSYKKPHEERPQPSERAPNYSARNLEKTFVQDSYKKMIPDSPENRQIQQRSQNENRQNRERSPYKGRVTSRSLSPTRRESLDYFQTEIKKSLMKDSHKDMKPKSFEENLRNKNEECREDDSSMIPISSRKEYTPQRDPNEVRPFSRNDSPIRSQEPPGYLKREVEKSAIKDLCKEPESREPERHIKHGASKEADGRIKQESREVGSHKHESTREEVTPIEEKTFREKYRPQRHQKDQRPSSRNDGPSRSQAAVDYFKREIGESLKDSQKAVQPESFEVVDRNIKHESARETDRHIKPESSRQEYGPQRHPKKEGQSSRGTSPIKGQSFDNLKEDGNSLKDSHMDVKPETLKETTNGPFRKQNKVPKERRPPSRSPSPKKRQVVDGFNREMRESLLEGLSYPKSLTYPDRQMQLSSPNRSPRDESSERNVFNKLRSTSKSTSPDRGDSKREIETLVNDSFRKFSPDSHREERGTSPESQRVHKVSSNDSYREFSHEISNFTRQIFPEQYKSETGTPRSLSPNRSVPGLEKSNRTMRQELMKDAYQIVNPGSSKEANRLVNPEPLDVSHREAGPDDSSLFKKSPNATYPVVDQEMVNESNSYEDNKLASRSSRSLSVLDEMRQLDDELDESYRELPESLKEPKVHRVASTTFTDTCSDATVIKGPDHSSNQRINNSPNRQSRQSRSRSSSPMRSHASLNDSIRQMRESLIHSSHSQLPGTFQQVKSRVSSPHRSPREMREAVLNNSYQRESPRRYPQESPTEFQGTTPVAYQSPDEHRHASGHDRESCRGPYADSDEDTPNDSYQHFKQEPPAAKPRPSSSPYQDLDSHPEWLETFESGDRPDDVCGSSRSFSPRRNTSTDGTYSLPASYRSTSPCKSHTSDPYPRDNSSSSTECHDEQRECFEFQPTCEDNEPPRASCLACQENDESYSEIETVCEKDARCVTFNDEDCSVIDWDRVLLEDGEEDQSVRLPHTCRSSSSADHTCRESIYGSAEHTCTESVCGDDCASGRQRDYDIPTFEACPCMYQTYLSLAAMCQSNERYIQ